MWSDIMNLTSVDYLFINSESYALHFFFLNFNRKNNIVLTVEHIVAIFFLEKDKG